MIEEILDSFRTEEYLPLSPAIKDSPEYKLLYSYKEHVRNYKWYEGEAGRNLSWQRAIREWFGKLNQSELDALEKIFGKGFWNLNDKP